MHTYSVFIHTAFINIDDEYRFPMYVMFAEQSDVKTINQ